MRFEARTSTSGLRLFARLTLATSIGGILFAICVIPNANNEKFHRWIPALAGVIFAGPIATALACRYCVDESAAYNDGYNDALRALSTPNPNEAQHAQTTSSAPIAQQNLSLLVSDLQQTSPVRPSFSSKDNRANLAVVATDGDEFDFLNASA